jgi:hypothetical protein
MLPCDEMPWTRSIKPFSRPVVLLPMRILPAPLLLIACTTALAQGPAVTSWILNPGGETGYGGYLSNVESVYYTPSDVYVSAACIPGYDIGPWTANPNTPANQNFVFKITRSAAQNTGAPVNTPLGHVGVWRNGVSIFNARDGMSYNNQGVWNRDALVWEGISFDDCLGHAAGNGEYHHHVTPNCLYDHLNDAVHSELIGYAFDGFPIYGAHGFANADGSGGITRMRSSYQLRTISTRATLPNGTVLNTNQYGPTIAGQYPLGAFLEDYEFVPGLGDLDVHNGRHGVTPEHPEGTYAYFVTLNEQYTPAYPYVLGPTYYGTVQAGNTGPMSGHNIIPPSAILFDPNATTEVTEVAMNTFSLFPVPAVNVLTIRSTGAALLSVDVVDGTGRMVHRASADGPAATLDLSALPAGTYAARIGTVDGHTATRSFLLF